MQVTVELIMQDLVVLFGFHATLTLGKILQKKERGDVYFRVGH